uniref:Uncharacterized protein n=1 Tax=viral metagenome TaxID=1070528 RepID=A0A6C0HC57_9ZZZZ
METQWFIEGIIFAGNFLLEIILIPYYELEAIYYRAYNETK